MVKVILLYTQRCPHCPAAKELWRKLKEKYDFEYEEIDAMTNTGRELAMKHRILGVPTTIINGKVAFVGVPDESKAEEIVKG